MEQKYLHAQKAVNCTEVLILAQLGSLLILRDNGRVLHLLQMVKNLLQSIMELFLMEDTSTLVLAHNTFYMKEQYE
jgi:hypothetical protein